MDLDRARERWLRVLHLASARAESMDARTLASHSTLLHHTTRLSAPSSSLGFNLTDFTVLQRLGKRHTPVGGSKYYGVNSAVYRCQLQLLGVDVTVAMKAIYNLTRTTTYVQMLSIPGTTKQSQTKRLTRWYSSVHVRIGTISAGY